MAKRTSSTSQLIKLFLIPGIVVCSIVGGIFFRFIIDLPIIDKGILLIGIAAGSFQLIWDSIMSLRRKSFALDYIAILAIITGLVTGNLFVASVIVLMMAGGNTLEAYAQDRARKSLTSLSNRIPHHVAVIEKNDQHVSLPIEKVVVGSLVLVRKGEVVPLDGTLYSPESTTDESSLTGEPYPVTKEKGDAIRSGVVNVGEAMVVQTTVSDENSTYRHIIHLVQLAQNEKTPFLQLADTMSGWFTVVSLLLAGIAFALSGDINRVLAVLVIATPCPLILATPIALIGGMNAAAARRIIFKRLSALEILSKVKAVIFDKTGTLTFGIPDLTLIEATTAKFSETEILAISAGMERNSLHPFAKAILDEAKTKKITPVHVTSIHEKIGVGLTGEYDGHIFQLSKNVQHPDKISLLCDEKVIAHLEFSDVLKPASAHVLSALQSKAIELFLFTGDTKARAHELLKNLPDNIIVKADCSPEQKRQGIEEIKKQGKLTAMVGDGINDAPALALADVGIVFSHEEQTAASEAADVILLEGHFEGVLQALELSRHTLAIAKQSIFVGLGLSLAGMMIAMTGHLSPITGAVSQEVIDVAVILNALRAAFPPLAKGKKR